MDSGLIDFLNSFSAMEVKETMGVDDKPWRSGLSKFIQYTGYETRLEYKMLNQNKEEMGLAQEDETKNIMPFSIKSSFLGKRRPLSLTVTDKNFKVVLRLKRPFHVLASTTVVCNKEGAVLGYIWQRFNPFFYRHYELRDERKKILAFIRSPVWKAWTCPILNPAKKKIGLIKKQNPSLGQYMTYRETLKLECANMPLREKMLTLATAFTLSIDLFERSNY